MDICRRFLRHKHPKYGTPWIAILISSVIYALLAFRTLAQLLTVYVWLRILVTLLTVLRRGACAGHNRRLKRPFRIPWGNWGLAYVVVAPILMSVVALVGSDKFALKWGPIPCCWELWLIFVFPKLTSSRRNGEFR